MSWKKIAGGLVAAAIIGPIAYYSWSIDWGTSHADRTATLPLFCGEIQNGEQRVYVRGFEFKVRIGGTGSGNPPIIALHGFPESSVMWRALTERAAPQGYQTIAFDQRGYSPGARPWGKDNYNIDELAKDALAVAKAYGADQFHLVSHDWGAAVAWRLAAKYPKRVLSLSALSIPHFGVFLDNVQNNPEQATRSSYFEFFRTPLLPEFMMSKNDFEVFRVMMQARPAYELDEYLAILSEPGALTATLNWYRAMDEEFVKNDPLLMAPVTVPTLFIWGTNDGVIARSTVEAQRAMMPDDYTEIELDAGHGIIQEKPDEVVDAILDLIKRTSPQ